MRAALSFALTLSVSVLGVSHAPRAQPDIHPDELKLKPRVDAAIDRGVEALINGQYSDGYWGRWGNYDGGKTALCAYALLKCGVAVDHPSLKRAFLYIDGVKPTQTYTVACLMLAYGSTGLPEHQVRVKKLAALLIDWERGGDFGYGERLTRPDLSNTQYAALGFWIAQKHKVKIPSANWRQLLKSTLRYREKPKAIATERKGKHTVSAGKQMIAGFGYTPRGKPTGSMTAAGISILQICKIGLGEKLVRAERRRIDAAVDAGVAWLGHNFSVTKNPGARGWLYYYLYGLERVGSLTRTEKFGEHWWYLTGAQFLLSQQKKNGMWPKGNSANPEAETAFALLFLRRATSAAAVTGQSGGGGDPKHLFTAGTKDSDVVIGGAGQQPLSLWVKDFGKKLKERHERYGLRVLQVEYLKGDRVLGQLAGKPDAAWTTDAFLYRANALPRGMHQIQARIKLVAAETPPGENTPTETVVSPKMKVQIRDVFASWMEVAASMAGKNLLRRVKVKASASSQKKSAAAAADGKASTRWVCAKNDANPALTLELSPAVQARGLMIGQAGSRVADATLFDRITVVEVWINRAKEPLRVELDPDPLAVTLFELPRSKKIRWITLRIADRVPGGRNKGQAGFSEIALTK